MLVAETPNRTRGGLGPRLERHYCFCRLIRESLKRCPNIKRANPIKGPEGGPKGCWIPDRGCGRGTLRLVGGTLSIPRERDQRLRRGGPQMLCEGLRRKEKSPDHSGPASHQRATISDSEESR